MSQYFLPWLGYQEYYLAREQIRMDHEVRVVTSNLRWPLGPYSALARSEERREMPLGRSIEHGVPSTRLRVAAAPMGRLVLAGLGAEIVRFAPDVVHAHGYLLATTFAAALTRAGSVLPGRRRFRLLVDEHQLPHQSVPGRLHRTQRRLLASFARVALLPAVDELVAVAEGARRWLIDEYFCPADRIQLIPLGADTDVFRPDESLGANTRAELLIGANHPLVVCTGKISPQKRLDLLVQATALIPLERRPILLFVGSSVDETRRSLVSLAETSGVDLRVLDAVAPERLPAYFNAADLCVWPADCTVSHLEAASCGRPIIIPAEPGIMDRVDAGNGLAIPTGDVEALALGMDRLLRDPAERKKFGERGRQVALERYSWRTIALRFEELYMRPPATSNRIIN